MTVLEQRIIDNLRGDKLNYSPQWIGGKYILSKDFDDSVRSEELGVIPKGTQVTTFDGEVRYKGEWLFDIDSPMANEYLIDIDKEKSDIETELDDMER